MQLNPDALEIAKVLDNERDKGIVRGTLHGILLSWLRTPLQQKIAWKLQLAVGHFSGL